MKRISLLVLSIITALCAVFFGACNGEEMPEFKIKFIVDNELYATVSVLGGEEIEIPEKPVKEGYEFDGWYFDKDVWKNPFTASSLTEETLSEDIMLYAKFTEKHKHFYDEIITKEPTCIETGVIMYVCACGDNYTETINTTEHTPAAAVEENRIEPKCKENGGYDLVVYCSVCREELSREYKEIAALEHTPAAAVEENRIEPKCEDKGSYDLVVYCSVCGAELSRGHHEIDALEHKYGEWMETKAPTCIENGEETRYCENDNAHIETREINALGHTSGAAVEENRVEPSYDDNGSYDLVVYCSVCGEELSREHHEIDALVHTPAAAIEENRIEPKCEENGGYDLVVYCSECGAELSREHKEISAIGHKYGEWIETKAPTCIENGEETRYCENDNVHKETRKINALGHTPKAAIEENRIEPKCEESGGYDLVVYCSVCGEELSREHNEIAALEHSYTAVVTEPTCTEQGYTTHTCDKCNYSYTDNYVAALGHSYKDGYIFDDDYHWQETTCGHSDAIIKVAHNFGDNNICSACGYNALKYVKIEGKEEYAVCELTNGDVKNIYIPDTYEDLPVTKINDKVFYCNTTIEKVIMSDNITYVGESAFYNCINLNTIVLSESLQIIKNSTFASCSSLTSITIPDSVIIIGNYAFYECNNLTDVVIGKKLRDIGSMAFYLCTELTSITIPDSVNSIGHGAFYACDKLITVNIGNGVTEIEGETFYGCGRLREVIFGENSQLTKIGYSAFKNCYDLTAITIPEKVTEIEDGYLFFDLPAFANCGRLVEVYNKSSLEIEAGSTAYGYVGYYARAILTDISESKISKDENGFVMYNGDTDTVFIRYDGEETDLVLPQCNIIQSYAFVYGNITTVILPEDIEEIGEFSFNGCANLKSINIPNKVRRMGTRAFSGCQSLSSTIILDKIESIGEWAFYGCSSLTSVTMGNSVTSIGQYAFADCSSLTSITIPDSVEIMGELVFAYCRNLETVIIDNGVKTISDGAFRYCSNLLYLTIGNGVESIGKDAFRHCTNLTEIIIPDSVKYLGEYAFQECTGLERVLIGKGVTAINSYAFEGCESLMYVTFADDSQLSEIFHAAFGDCKRLQYVDFGLNSKLEKIGIYAFYNCSGLLTLTIPENVKEIERAAFYHCDSLKKVTINSVYFTMSGEPSETPFYFDYNIEEIFYVGTLTQWLQMDNLRYLMSSNAKTLYINGQPLKTAVLEGVTEIQLGAFRGVVSLEEVIIGEGVKVIDDSAFNRCVNLAKVVMADSVETIGANAFQYCSSLDYFTISKNIKSIGNFAFWNCGKLSDTIVLDNVESIGANAFNGAGLESVTIGNKITVIEEGVFFECKNLKNVIIPNSVEKISYIAFYGCTALESITLPFIGETLNGTTNTHFGYIFGAPTYATNVYNVSQVLKNVIITGGNSITDYAFYECKFLSIMIPDSVTSIGNNAFYNCNSLTDITVAEDNPNYKSIDGNLYNKDGTALIKYAPAKTATEFIMPDNVTSIVDYAFAYCRSLTSIEMPDGVISIGEYAFAYCRSLTSLNISNSVTSIGNSAFCNCSNLTSVNIPNGVTSIGKGTFVNCSSLNSITIPDSVISIGNSAFYSCGSLTYITYNGTVSEWEQVEKASDWNERVPAKVIHCFGGDVNLNVSGGGGVYY